MKTIDQYQIKSNDIDLDKLISLRLEALQTNPEAFGERFDLAAKRTPDEWKSWYSLRQNEKSKIFVIMKNHKYVGMCGFSISNSLMIKPFLWGIYISPCERNRGLGRKLLKKVIENVKGSQFHFLTLNVEKENKEALLFYKSLGFEKSGIDLQQIEMKLKFG